MITGKFIAELCTKNFTSECNIYPHPSWYRIRLPATIHISPIRMNAELN